MIKVDNISNRTNNTTSYKGVVPVKTWSQTDLQARVAEIVTEAQRTNAIASSNPFSGFANRVRDIASIIQSGNITSQKIRNVEAGLNLMA